MHDFECFLHFASWKLSLVKEMQLGLCRNSAGIPHALILPAWFWEKMHKMFAKMCISWKKEHISSLHKLLITEIEYISKFFSLSKSSPGCTAWGDLQGLRTYWEGYTRFIWSLQLFNFLRHVKVASPGHAVAKFMRPWFMVIMSMPVYSALKILITSFPVLNPQAPACTTTGDFSVPCSGNDLL